MRQGYGQGSETSSKSFGSVLRTVLATVVVLSSGLAVPSASQPSVNATKEQGTVLGLPAAAVSAPDRQASTTSSETVHAQQILGARLFMDRRLSADSTISCASCHVPEQAFSDGKALAVGLHGAMGVRNTPSLINVYQVRNLFWDGRRTSLETQAADPLVHPLEHGLASAVELERILQSDAAYREHFNLAFPGSPQPLSASHAYAALAAFERTLLGGDSAFDRFMYGHDNTALGPAAKRGYALFSGRAQCASCHLIGPQAAPLSDERFHALGVGLGAATDRLPALLRQVIAPSNAHRSAGELLVQNPELAVLGRYLVTRDAQDIGAFRTPSLRDVAMTAPYMHDGSIATLEEAVDHEVFYRGRQDGRLLILTPAERADLVAFLQALTSSGLDELAHRVRRMAQQ